MPIYKHKEFSTYTFCRRHALGKGIGMCSSLTKSDSWPSRCEKNLALLRSSSDPGCHSLPIPERFVLFPAVPERSSRGLIRDVFYECKKLASYALPISFSFICLVFKTKTLVDRQNEHGIIVVLSPSMDGTERHTWSKYGEAELIGACFAPKFIKPGLYTLKSEFKSFDPKVNQIKTGLVK